MTSNEAVVDVKLGATGARSAELMPSAGWWPKASASAWSIHTEVNPSLDSSIAENKLIKK
jgi:hypothetical protein